MTDRFITSFEFFLLMDCADRSHNLLHDEVAYDENILTDGGGIVGDPPIEVYSTDGIGYSF